MYKLTLKYSNNHYLKSSKLAKIKPFYINRKFRGKERLFEVINRPTTISNMLKGNYDIFHPTYYNNYFLKYLGKKLYVVTVFDMIHEKYPDLFLKSDKTRLLKKKLIKKAAKIIAISENTKKDIKNIYNVEDKMIEVIHLGSSIDLKLSEIGGNYKLPPRYLLFIGKRSHYKNFDRFIKAVAPILIDFKDIRVVCGGGESFSKEEKRLFSQLKIEGKIHHFTFHNDSQLIALYKNALFFVYPSLYEGFGIPILEAFNCSCPVLLSNTSSFPEIAADAAEYFNPEDINSIHETIRKTINNEELRQDLKKKR